MAEINDLTDRTAFGRVQVDAQVIAGPFADDRHPSHAPPHPLHWPSRLRLQPFKFPTVEHLTPVGQCPAYRFDVEQDLKTVGVQVAWDDTSLGSIVNRIRLANIVR